MAEENPELQAALQDLDQELEVCSVYFGRAVMNRLYWAHTK